MKKQKSIISFLILVVIIAVPMLVSAQWNLATLPQHNLPGGTVGIQGIIYNAMQWILTLLAALGIIGFVIAGIMYLLSGGDDTRMKSAKNAMVAAIIGVVVGIMGLVIMYAAQNFLIGTATNF